MKILIIESSTEVCSVCVVDEHEVLHLEEIEQGFVHSRELVPLIQKSLKANGLKTSDLSAVAVSAGPGSYTGLRVGSSTAKAICFASNLPFIGLDTLKGLSYAPHAIEKGCNNYIFSMIDARRDEVYVAVYDPNHHVLYPGKPKVLHAESFERFRQTNAKWHLCGSGADKAQNLLSFENMTVSTAKISSTYFQKMAVEALKQKAFEDVNYFTPNYFKPPNITKSNKSLI